MSILHHEVYTRISGKQIIRQIFPSYSAIFAEYNSAKSAGYSTLTYIHLLRECSSYCSLSCNICRIGISWLFSGLRAVKETPCRTAASSCTFSRFRCADLRGCCRPFAGFCMASGEKTRFVGRLISPDKVAERPISRPAGCRSEIVR